MAGYDVGQVSYSFQAAAAVDEEAEAQLELNPEALTVRQAHYKFINFIRQFTSETGESGRRTYSDLLDPEAKVVRIDLQHVKSFDSILGDNLESRPAEMLPVLEAVVQKQLVHLHSAAAGAADDGEIDERFRDFQVELYSSTAFGPSGLRGLSSNHVSKLVSIPGIVTGASRARHKATLITIQCSTCKGTQVLTCKPGMGGAILPTTCTLAAGGQGVLPAAGQDGGPDAGRGCGPAPFVILPEKCTFVDQQTLKIQERPEDVPTGELPRTLLTAVDRALVGRVSPGTRVRIVGIYSILEAGKTNSKGERAAVAVRQPYIRAVGVEEEGDGNARSRPTFTPEEEQKYQAFAKQPNVHDKIAKMVAPQIFGSESVKAAVGVLLFGGSRKAMPDGTFRRGDVNVLLLGDPSTAKSQILKFASRIAPIAVYTSGKGSSAAGLTASVVRDANSREFYLEGGAMVLADGGVVCIDEFDKMRPEDRVAIHEAMEQQTISIAKAGITTMLTSRCSVLAAANPPSGRYDDLATAEDNIDLQTTILSRFDLIFIVRDERSEERDAQIARHVLRVHADAGRGAGDAAATADEDFLRRYILYARHRCAPRLSEDAAARLSAEYVKIRADVRGRAGGGDANAIPVTVRQLEALVRISESRARMQLLTEVREEHVADAIRMFEASTLDAAQSGLAEAAALSDEARAELAAVEAHINRRLAIGQVVAERKLVADAAAVGLSERLIRRALVFMISRGELEHRSERRFIKRVR